MLSQPFFLLSLSLLTLHELDAIRCREWRIFPGLSLLNDRVGFIVFLFAHVPLFYWIFAQLTHSINPGTFQRGFNVFMIAHLAAHLLLLKHPKNEFTDWVSWTLIAGAAVAGALSLLLT